MSEKPLKKRALRVFLGPVNYGTQAGVLASKLRELDVWAESITYSDGFDRKTDQVINEPQTTSWKLITLFLRIRFFFRFNTFVFFFGRTLLPQNLDLPFYRFFGKKVFIEYLGWDAQQAIYSIEKYRHTNAQYYKDKPLDELQNEDIVKAKRIEKQAKYAHTQIVCAPYLSEFVEDSVLLPLAFPCEQIRASPKQYTNGKTLRILHAPTHKGNKGTEFIEEALVRLRHNGYSFDYARIENVPHKELQKAYDDADLFIDQLLIGWYGTASIEAMAKGCPTVCFLRDSYSEHCPYYDKIPIINANPDSIYEILLQVFQGEFDLGRISYESLKFVHDVHSDSQVAARLLNIVKGT